MRNLARVAVKPFAQMRRKVRLLLPAHTSGMPVTLPRFRSLTQCGEPMRFAMAAPIDLRNDFDSVSLRASRRAGRDPEPSSAGVGRGLRWWQQDGCARIGGVGCRSFATGCCASTPADRTGWSMGSHRAHPRSSTPIRAEVVEAGPVPAVDGGRWRRKDLARWTWRRSISLEPRWARLKALGFAKISARPRHSRKTSWPEAFKKNFPAELAKIRARLERRRDRAVVAR